MSKADERAAKARSLILKGEQKSVVAEQLDYKSVGGMLNAIVMLEHREKIGHSTPYKAVRAMQSPGKSDLEIKKPQEKVDVLGETWQGGDLRGRHAGQRPVCEAGGQVFADQLHRVPQIREHRGEMPSGPVDPAV